MMMKHDLAYIMKVLQLNFEGRKVYYRDLRQFSQQLGISSVL